jgi:hypothetical protein
MAQETEHLSLEEFLRHVAESLKRARQAANGVVLEDQGDTYRITFEGEKSEATQTRAAQDPFLALDGAYESATPSDVANHKHDYLADAYQDMRTSL